MRSHDIKQRDEEIGMPSGSDGWVGYAALVVAVGCIPMALAALANDLLIWAAIGFVAALVLGVTGVMLLRHSEKHEGPHFFDRGMAMYRRRPRREMR